MLLPLAFLVPLTSLLPAAAPELIPPPQEATWNAGTLPLPHEVRIAAPPKRTEALRQYAWILDEALRAKGPYRTLVVNAEPVSPPTDDAIIRISEASGISPGDTYTLSISTTGVMIDTTSSAGLFSAFATLAQLIEQADPLAPTLPTGTIRDWPAVPLRAVHIDLTCQQFTPAYVCRLMRTLAGYKVNAILMEYSGQFPFRTHSAIRRPDAFTDTDLAEIRRTAAECHQEIIPFLQCLGHLEYVLHVPEYSTYGQAHGGYMLCPSSPEAVPFACSLIDEILAAHPGLRHLQIGGDEVSAGRCPSCTAFVKAHGFSALYVQHYQAISAYCHQKGVRPLLWSDMMVQHPEALADLPRDAGWVVWDYDTTTDPARSVAHGASLNRMDRLSPAYRQVFGPGIGLDDAQQRGGFIAFGHARGFTGLGFEAYTAPAARSAGDQFDLPRFTTHMRNIRVAFRQAAEFKLPGAILTSWSYRGAPHEVCLPEYICAAYGWNPAAPDVEPLFAAFLRQRYGLDDAPFVRNLLDLTPVVPPTMRATPKLDDGRRAWLVNADAQLDQLKRALERDGTRQIQLIAGWLPLVERAADQLDALAPLATRHQHELVHWRLSLQHLRHRLRWLEPLTRLAAVAYTGAAASEAQLGQWAVQLADLAPERTNLRREWEATYTGVATRAHLQIELEYRFDAEPTVEAAVLAAVRSAATRPAATSPAGPSGR